MLTISLVGCSVLSEGFGFGEIASISSLASRSLVSVSTSVLITLGVGL